MKNFTVSMTYMKYGNSSIEVPDDMSRVEAIEYAKKNKSKIPLPKDAFYIPDSDELVNEEEWDFE